MTPDEQQHPEPRVPRVLEAMDYLASRSAWWMFILMLVLNILTNWIIVRYFAEEMRERARLLVVFAASEDRMARAQNMRTEADLLRIAADAHADPQVKEAALSRAKILQERMRSDPSAKTLEFIKEYEESHR